MGSNIKGGGRAILSDEAEEELISFLMSRRQEQVKDEGKSSTSDHHRKREQKRFLKQLVERYERVRLANKFNSSSNNDEKTTSGEASNTNKSLKGGNAGGKHKKNSSGGGDGGKVRVNLVEAIYGKGKKKGGTKSKQQQENSFKEGGKKLAVYPRNSSVQELMKDFQTKLRMKKKPIRCFIVENKMELNLIGDLSGVSDGATVYITLQPQQQEQQQEDGKEEKEDLASDARGRVEDETDPLDLVKQAYLQRDHRQPKKGSGRQRTVLQPHPEFDQYFTELEPLSEERAFLPAASCRETILQKVQNNRVVVICGMTGCGKSTQIPQFLWEGMKASGCCDAANIIVTQPRRVAATSLAQRVSNEMNSTIPGEYGSLVGHNVRLDRAVSDSAKIVYCTVGILLRMLLSPREGGTENNNNEKNDNTLQPAAPLSSVSHVIIDEVHERDMNTDFVLTLLRSFVLTRNQHIRIILMSATASATKFVRYFEETMGIEPAVITIPGRTFPVDMHWLEDCEKFSGSRLSNRPEIVEERSPQEGTSTSTASPPSTLSPRATQKIDNLFVKDLICAMVRGQQQQAKTAEKETSENGAILVFLPGKGEIDALAKVLYDDPTVGDKGRCNILKLHSGIPKGSQQIVFKPAKTGTTKIVLATNIAETSLTIPDIKHVIDTGRVKENRFNSSTRIKELVTVWTSRASAKQRSGRAGRTSAGKCWRLYSEQFSNNAMLEQTPPEILRTPLDELILQVCLLWEQRRDEQNNANKEKGSPSGLCPKAFLSKTPDPPTDDNLDKACEHLLEVDAIRFVSTGSKEEAGPILYRLTPIGYHLSRLPMDTKVGKVLLVGCMLGCLDSALTVAASLSCTKSCFLQLRWNNTSGDSSNSGGIVNQQQVESIQDKRNHVIKTGFGGEDWIGGMSKGDLICTIATYNEWSKRNTFKTKMTFCRDLSLDSLGLNEIRQLRDQFFDCLVDAGLVSSTRGGGGKDDNNTNDDRFNNHKNDALLTSCCFVAGLYPNVCTLMRPRKGGPKGGRLITKDGNICRPSSSSFQRTRVQKAAEVGRDAYAVFHAKHRTIGATSNIGSRNNSNRPTGHGETFLSEVNFVSRMAILLFGGELEINKNAVIVDGWLKFKIGDKGLSGAVLILALRDELDNCILRQLVSASGGGGGGRVQQDDKDTETLISIVRKLLSDE